MVTKSKHPKGRLVSCVFGGKRGSSYKVVLVLCMLGTLFVSEGH